MTTKPITFQEAQRKARFGHRDWITWRDREGVYHVERCSPATIKAAMLAKGTQGRWILIAASTGVPFTYGWRAGVTMLRNARYGW